MGVGDISSHGEEVLKALTPTHHARLQGFPFRAMLQMMSASVSAAQRGADDEIFRRIFEQFKHCGSPEGFRS
jgi:hypothetical protein